MEWELIAPNFQNRHPEVIAAHFFKLFPIPETVLPLLPPSHLQYFAVSRTPSRVGKSPSTGAIRHHFNPIAPHLSPSGISPFRPLFSHAPPSNSSSSVLSDGSRPSAFVGFEDENDAVFYENLQGGDHHHLALDFETEDLFTDSDGDSSSTSCEYLSDADDEDSDDEYTATDTTTEFFGSAFRPSSSSSSSSSLAHIPMRDDNGTAQPGDDSSSSSDSDSSDGIEEVELGDEDVQPHLLSSSSFSSSFYSGSFPVGGVSQRAQSLQGYQVDPSTLNGVSLGPSTSLQLQTQAQTQETQQPFHPSLHSAADDLAFEQESLSDTSMEEEEMGDSSSSSSSSPASPDV